MTRDGVIGHVAGGFELSMGRAEPLPPQTGIPFPKLVGWLLANGLVSIPKGVKFKGADGEVAPAVQVEGGIEKLREVMEEFIALQQAHTCLVQHLYTLDQRLGMSPDEPERAQAFQLPNEAVTNKLLHDLAEKDEKLHTLRQERHELETQLAQQRADFRDLQRKYRILSS